MVRSIRAFRHMANQRKPHLGKSMFIIKVVKIPISSSVILIPLQVGLSI